MYERRCLYKLHKGGEGEEQIWRRDWAKQDYKVEKWLKVVCAANGVSPCEVTSFVSRSVPSSLEAAHDDELLLLEGLETVRAKSSSSGEKKDVRPFKGNHLDVIGRAEA
ncbi:hypothetical protein AWC38_SpisGene11594 [Stylophora pistillata]|uniref:Uncharacterized protein n=1 Tax=Stylophora pistillata TaxID=50429 RepID=A0A2B4S1S8_STYPI|nr:hypothetical protein AWC38_SpisGene11594 [Stylophora pistillata]